MHHSRHEPRSWVILSQRGFSPNKSPKLKSAFGNPDAEGLRQIRSVAFLSYKVRLGVGVTRIVK
jgi:hypothetical protein